MVDNANGTTGVVGSACSTAYVPPKTLSASLLEDIPQAFATSHADVDGIRTTVALEHEANPSQIPDDVRHWRVFADRVTIPREGIQMNRGFSVVAHTLAQANAADPGCPPADTNVSGGPPPSKPPKPGRPGYDANGNGIRGSNGGDAHKGADGNPVTWLMFKCVGEFTIESDGGRGQDGGDGGDGGDGRPGRDGPDGYETQVRDGTHFFHTECVDGGPATPGGNAGSGGDGKRAGDGGDAGQITVQIASRGAHIKSTSSNGGPPGNPGTHGSPGTPGGGARGGKRVRGEEHGGHFKTLVCVEDGRYPNVGGGATANNGGDGAKGNSGVTKTPNITAQVSLADMRNPDPYRFAAFQLSLRNALKTAVSDPEQARSTLTWLRMVTPHEPTPAFGPHWTALHRRAALLLRRIDRSRDPFVIDHPMQPPGGAQELLANALALGRRVERMVHAYVASSTTNADDIDSSEYHALAKDVSGACQAIANARKEDSRIAADALANARAAYVTALSAARESLSPTGNREVDAASSAVIHTIQQHQGAWESYAARPVEDEGADIDALLQRVSQAAPAPSWDSVTQAVQTFQRASEPQLQADVVQTVHQRVGALVKAAREAHDAFESYTSAEEEQAWIEAIIEQINGQLDDAKTAPAHWSDPSHPPFRTFLYMTYEDLRLLTARLYAQIYPAGFHTNGQRLGGSFEGMTMMHSAATSGTTAR